MSESWYSSPSDRAPFTRHQSHEVATSLTQAKQVAQDLAENERYLYRATATLLGDVELAPYDAIYLDNLPGGMTGWWTVLSVRHIFGHGITYKCEVELGTDQLGLGAGAPPNMNYRDVDAELAGASPEAKSVYVDQVFMPSLSNNRKQYGTVEATTATTNPVDKAPDFTIIRRQSAWRAK